MYAARATAVESCISAHHGMSIPAGRPRRAQGARFRVHEVRVAERTRALPLQDVCSAWWARTRAVLARILHHRRRFNGVRQRATLAAACQKLVTDYPSQAHQTLHRMWSWAARLEHLRDPFVFTTELLADLVEVADKGASGARGAALQASLDELRSWIAEDGAVNILRRSFKK
eukprot:3240549-Pyramimonas_sp.AAC.1